MEINEEFLAYCWKVGAFGSQNLLTTQGQSLQIQSFGKRNPDSGADFQMACVEIEGLKWVGAIEIHFLASDWFRHGHDRDPAYNNVVLHLVWKNDSQAIRFDGSEVPQLEVHDKIDLSHYHNFVELREASPPFACRYGFHRVPLAVVDKALKNNLQARLMRKSDLVLELLNQNRLDWEETAHQILGKSLGFKVNAEPFFYLARNLPFKVLRKHADHPEQLEALAFGVAGFLEGTFVDPYIQSLQNEYWYLAHKYKLETLPAGYWKFLRLRPPNFPTVRIAQWTALLNRFPNFFSRMLFWQDKNDLIEIFQSEQSSYWQAHHLPDKLSLRPTGKMGKDAVYSLVINVVCPILVAYSRAGNGEQFYQKAMEALEFLPPEKNSITTLWSEMGLKANSASQSQALIELKTQNCDSKNCLDCPIGQFLISPSHTIHSFVNTPGY
jgi:hypothetical protein